MDKKLDEYKVAIKLEKSASLMRDAWNIQKQVIYRIMTLCSNTDDLDRCEPEIDSYAITNCGGAVTVVCATGVGDIVLLENKLTAMYNDYTLYVNEENTETCITIPIEEFIR